MASSFDSRRAHANKQSVLVLILLIVTIFALRSLSHDSVTPISFGSAPSRFVESAEVRALAAQAHLTDAGRSAFLGAQPQILDGSAFDRQCDVHRSDFITGCTFDGPPSSIYLFRVTDARLAGMADVTAAHEMLHAVWNSMTPEEQAVFVPLLQAEYVRHRSTLAPRMKVYGSVSRATFYSELHSIEGTEVLGLSPTLRVHFDNYIVDRAGLISAGARADKVLDDADELEYSLGRKLDRIRDQDSAEYQRIHARWSAAYDENSELRFAANKPVDP